MHGEGEEVDMRGCVFEDCEQGGSIRFHVSYALFMVKEKEKKEADIGIVVTLPLVVEWASIE